MSIMKGSTLGKMTLTAALSASLVATSIGPAMAETAVAPPQPVAVTDEVAHASDADTQVAWLPIITAVILAGGAADGMGRQAAIKLHDAGLSQAEYEGIKWGLRAAVIELLTPIFGGIFMVSFENTFYRR